MGRWTLARVLTRHLEELGKTERRRVLPRAVKMQAIRANWTPRRVFGPFLFPFGQDCRTHVNHERPSSEFLHLEPLLKFVEKKSRQFSSENRFKMCPLIGFGPITAKGFSNATNGDRPRTANESLTAE